MPSFRDATALEGKRWRVGERAPTDTDPVLGVDLQSSNARSCCSCRHTAGEHDCAALRHHGPSLALKRMQPRTFLSLQRREACAVPRHCVGDPTGASCMHEASPAPLYCPTPTPSHGFGYLWRETCRPLLCALHVPPPMNAARSAPTLEQNCRVAGHGLRGRAWRWCRAVSRHGPASWASSDFFL